VILIDQPLGSRLKTAGRSSAAERLSSSARRVAYDNLARLADCIRSRGLVPVLHPHAGSCTEFWDEIEHVVNAPTLAEMDLCLDSGHLAYAGIDRPRRWSRYVTVSVTRSRTWTTRSSIAFAETVSFFGKPSAREFSPHSAVAALK
jgi:hypothetical protein